ncbi:MAG: hypothetical protein IH987_17360, partial [Planctomycetes bacterium]|nr:hypothetical protein [Planctomycetota bacterium]
GCRNVADNANSCDDGNVCNGLESCVSGVCQSGTPLTCDDGNLCTDDSCDARLGCVTTNNTVTCDDADPCTENDACSGGLCAGTFIGGCQNCTLDSECDDANACNGAEICSGGTCQSGTAPNCDDGNVCTDNECDGSGSCLANNDTDSIIRARYRNGFETPEPI